VSGFSLQNRLYLRKKLALFVSNFSSLFPPSPPPPPPLTSVISASPVSTFIGQTATIYITWNDTVIDFTLPAFTVTNGTLSDLTEVSATHYTALFTPTADIIALADIQIQQSGVGGAVYYNALSSPTTASNIVTVSVNTTVPASKFVVGVNISGAENSFPAFATAPVFNFMGARFTGTNNPVPLIRIPYCWSKPNDIAPYTGLVGAQPTANGPLDTTSTVYGGTTGYMGQLANLVQLTQNAGCVCILDNHMFGVGPGGYSVGTPQLPTTALAEFMGLIAAYFVALPSLLPTIDGIEIMNEWPNGFDSSIILTASQQSITAIRAAGFVGKIYIDGTNYSGAWNWTSGEGNPYNSSALYQLTDPIDNLVFEPHMYPDWDNSGSETTSFGYAVCSAIAGVSPPGLNTNPTIGVTRMDLEYLPWQQTHGVRGLLGEYGTSNDSPWYLGTFDYADWNVITYNLLSFLQTNNMGITFFASGPGFAMGPTGYCYGLDPYNVNLSGLPDYTSTGVQHPAWVVIDQFTGYTGAQPTAYMLFQPGFNNPIYYCTEGTPSEPFTVYYGGTLSSTVTITPHAYLYDGVTSAGGTFTPSTVTFTAGANGLATFTYTASQEATLIIKTTNNAGWHDPPSLSMSSLVDPYEALPAANLTNIYGLFNRFSPNTGPALLLQRNSDNAQMAFSFTVANADGILGLDRNAIQTWASQRTGIQIVEIYGIGPGQQNPITFQSGATPTLNLQNAAGYPEIEVNSAAFGTFNTPVNGQFQFTTIYNINQSSSAGMGPYRMDWFTGPIDCSTGGFSLGDSSNYPANNQSVAYNVVDGAYHKYAATWVNSQTNGFIGYKDAVSQSTATYTAPASPTMVGTTPFSAGLNPAFAKTITNFGYFQFFTGTQWRGSMYSMEIYEGYAATATVIGNINTYDSTYYSTALGDTLAAVAPTILGAGPSQLYGGVSNPFFNVTILDQNSGTPTDSVSITLSGATATLSGTGISGSNPYTISSASAASITATMQAATLSSSTSVGSVIDISFTVTSSAGTNLTSTACVVTVATYGTTTPFAAPSGTFTPINYKGTNMSGGENYPSPIYPINYTSQINYFASKGFGLIRMPINQANILTGGTAFAALDPTNLGEMKSTIDYCFSKNMWCIIDFHEAAGYPYGTVLTPGGSAAVGTSIEANNSFADTWSRISSAFKNYPNVIFGMMNEPVGMTASQWFAGMQPAFTAIRATGCTQLITVPGGGNFTGAHNWTQAGNASAATAWLATTPDPLNNFWFEMHEYLDSDFSGTHPVATQNGSTILDAPTVGLATTWARANGVKVLLGESGFAPDPWHPQASNAMGYDPTQPPLTTNGITQGGNMYSFMTSNSDVWAGWSYWVAGDFNFPPNVGGYAYTIEPPPSGDQPQMAVLTANL
jgi:endoglucanase